MNTYTKNIGRSPKRCPFLFAKQKVVSAPMSDKSFPPPPCRRYLWWGEREG